MAVQRRSETSRHSRSIQRGKLAEYRQKRRFDETPEPRGGKASKGQGMFVVQKHDATRLHYDFRLELDGVLKSWAVTRGPSLNPVDKRLAVRTEDHPIDYGDFEGTIPAGNYGAGTVMVWDTGRWRPIGDPHAGLAAGMLKFELMGQRLHGHWALVLMKGKSDAKRQNWLLIKENDEVVDRTHDLLADNPTSVISDRTLEQIAAAAPPAGGRAAPAASRAQRRKPAKREALPDFCKPALATLVDAVPDAGKWLYEIKFDGYRTEMACSGDEVRIYTRTGLDWTSRFPALARALGGLNLNGVLLDGEIVVVDEAGRTDFSELVRSLKAGEEQSLSFFAFDLLREDGKDLRALPLKERKARLVRLLQGASKKGPIFYTDHLESDGRRMLEMLCDKGFEGIIAKQANARYVAGRGREWLKIKCNRDQEFIIIGHRPSDKDRPFASLLLATHDEGKLRYAGRVGTGFDAGDFAELGRKFERLARDKPPAGVKVPADVVRDARWVAPELVAQIEFAGFTGDRIVRHGRYKGLREDKAAREVTLEKPAPLPQVAKKGSASAASKARASDEDVIAGVRLTHPDKILYPQQRISKRELARYYEAVAPVMLPFVKGRLASLVRCPEGPQRSCFFQKHKGAGLPAAFKTVAVQESDGESADYIYVDTAGGLAALAQIGALEYHIWGALAADYEHPDRLVFDLDPDPSLGFDDVRQGAELIRGVLDTLGLKSFPMLSGGKGIHVVAPLRRQHEWPVVSGFCKAVAVRIAKEDPERYVSVMSKSKRQGRIFIDYLRNQRGATAIAPYSTRSREGAPVAWPVSWDELGRAERANAITIKDVMAMLPDLPSPWAGYHQLKQGLKKTALDAMGIAVP